MEEILRLGAIHRICTKEEYKSFRKSFRADSAVERAFYRGMAYAYGFISDCFTRPLGDVLTFGLDYRTLK